MMSAVRWRGPGSIGYADKSKLAAPPGLPGEGPQRRNPRLVSRQSPRPVVLAGRSPARAIPMHVHGPPHSKGQASVPLHLEPLRGDRSQRLPHALSQQSPTVAYAKPSEIDRNWKNGYLTRYNASRPTTLCLEAGYTVAGCIKWSLKNWPNVFADALKHGSG